ncbi:protein kinase [Streptomyces sp. NPDC050439]|uniref:protein kinase domain-containing protein n=1 Tax=unclassified Streptomyces TaxID=2593676 RepID=UPI00341AAD3F
MRGRLLNGRYELLERLGAGGMGEVWRARDQSLGREVAVKLFAAADSADADELEQLLARFRQEARAAASLDSPYIVAVHDHGTDDGTDGGTSQPTPYLVMALVQGRSLDHVLRESVRVSVADALRWGADVCRALDAAHSAGVVHRDIKPGNIMITQDGTAKVVDFGIATFVERAAGDSRLTRTGDLPFGSVPYLAPERFRQEPGDGRTDLYALGCVLYELLVGRPPFTGSAAGVMFNHVNDAPLRPSRARPEVPAPVERLVLDLLAKDPADRPADAATTLERILAAADQGVGGDGGAGGADDDIQDAVVGERERERQAAGEVEDARPRPEPTPQPQPQPQAVSKVTPPPAPDAIGSRGRRRLLIPAALLLAVSIPTGLGIRSLAASEGGPSARAVYEIGVAHSYTHVGTARSGGGAEETSEYKQFTTQQMRTVESAFAETLGEKSGGEKSGGENGEKIGDRFRLVPVAADPDTTSRELLAEHPAMLAVIGDTVDFSWVHDTDEAFLPEISTCYDVAHAGGAFAIPADDERQGEAMAEYLLTRTDARRVLVAEDKVWADRQDGIGTGLRKAGVSAKALEVRPDEVKTAQIPALAEEARADAVVVPIGTDVAVWAKKLRADGFTGPVLSQSAPEGVCEDSEERARAEKTAAGIPEGVLRTRNYSGEPGDNLPARGNQELYDGALALATALDRLPTDTASPTSLRHTLDREIQNVSVNGVLDEVSFEKRRSARERPVWIDRREEDTWTEIGKVDGKYEPTKQ